MLRIYKTVKRDRGDAVLVTVVICIPLFMLAFMFAVGLAMNAWVKTSYADAAQAAATAAAADLNNSGYLGEGSLDTFVNQYMQLTNRSSFSAQQINAGASQTQEQNIEQCNTVTVNGTKHATPYVELRLDRTRALGTSDESSPLYVSAGGAPPTAVYTLNTRVNYRVISATVYEASTSLLGDGFAMVGKTAGCYTSMSVVSGITFGANQDLGLVGGDASCWVPTTPTDTPDAVMKTNGSIKLYSGADYTCPVVGYLNSPYVLTTHEYGSFYQISYGGNSYWVNSLDLQAPDTCTARPLADRTVTVSPAVQYSTGAGNVKTYTSPFPDCTATDTVSGDVSVVATYVGPYGSYYKISTGRWVLQSDLQVIRTIIFNANTGVGGGTVLIPNGSSLSSYVAPTRTGYTFAGWYTSASGGSQVTFPRTVNGNVTYYAQWSTNSYTITWNANGGSVAGCSPTTYSVTDGTITPSNATCSTKTRAGYSFAGWSPASIPAGSTGNKTFTAQWSIITYSIGYDANGGTISGSCGPTSYNVTSAKITPSCSPTRANYDFVSWSPSSLAAGSTGNMNFVAQWSLRQYTVQFDSRGGSAVTTQTVTQGNTVSVGNPTRSGWTFWGWGTTAGSGVTPNVSLPKVVTGDVTYYAHWYQTNSTYYSDAPNVYADHPKVQTVRVTASCARGSYNGAAVRAYVYGAGGRGYTGWAANGTSFNVYASIIHSYWGSNYGWIGYTNGGACTGYVNTTTYD